MRIYKKGEKSHLFIDLMGKRFGNIVAKEYVVFTTAGGKKEYRWKCLCDCGNWAYIRSKNLNDGSRIDCKSCSKKRQTKKQTLPDKLSIFHRIFRTYKRHAKNKSIPFELTTEMFSKIIQEQCEYCGEPPKKYDDGYNRNGIDRVDSSLGYVTGNIVPCCETCNRAKLDSPRKDFVKWIEKAYNHLKKV
jgi:hypothetical protein